MRVSLCFKNVSRYPPVAPPRPAAGFGFGGAKKAGSKPAGSSTPPGAGAQAPAGYWDPIGIADGISEEQFNRYREVEQKHGRIAMIAVVGYCVPGYIGTLGDVKLGGDVKFSDVPNGVQALFKIPPLGLLQILLLIGILETQFPNVQGDYGTGYFGQSLEEPVKSKKLAIELSNGRLAMLAIMGLLAQDVVSQGAPFDGPQFETGTFTSL
ncbi:chlorophyll A-B binding protein [Aureococcus anophagefferens]|nr:chlorophyll A-B binding protein [Aureococcus anophagefferens]